jgi:DNA-binding CsgD family transcriptional regulator
VRLAVDAGSEMGIADGEILDLVRRLADAVCQLRTDAYVGEGEEGVLLDVEVAGLRCLLVRFVPVTGARHPALSPREREIVRMVAQGCSNKTIAAVLDISTWTVSTHVRRIFAKLSVNSRAAMVAILLSEGELRQPGAPPPPQWGLGPTA